MGEVKVILYNGTEKNVDLDSVTEHIMGKNKLLGIHLPYVLDINRCDIKELHVRGVKRGEMSTLNLSGMYGVNVLTFDDVVGLECLLCKGSLIKEVDIPEPNVIESIQCNWFTNIRNFEEIDTERTDLWFI